MKTRSCLCLTGSLLQLQSWRQRKGKDEELRSVTVAKVNAGISFIEPGAGRVCAADLVCGITTLFLNATPLVSFPCLR